MYLAEDLRTRGVQVAGDSSSSGGLFRHRNWFLGNFARGLIYLPQEGLIGSVPLRAITLMRALAVVKLQVAIQVHLQLVERYVESLAEASNGRYLPQGVSSVLGSAQNGLHGLDPGVGQMRVLKSRAGQAHEETATTVVPVCKKPTRPGLSMRVLDAFDPTPKARLVPKVGLIRDAIGAEPPGQ